MGVVNARGRRLRIRLAAAVFAVLLSGAATMAFLAYSDAFTSNVRVTVTAERAGLGLDRDAKVKMLGVQVGRVTAIDYVDDQAVITLAIDTSQQEFIPANSMVRIASNTVFGAKAVEFLVPEHPAASVLPNGAHLEASAVSVEMNTLFETLVDTLHKIDPVQLNATLSAIGDGLRDNGRNLGAIAAGVNQYLAKINPSLPTLQETMGKAAVVGNVYADAAPDLLAIADNLPSLSQTIVDEQDNLNVTLLAAAGLADDTHAMLAPAADDYIAAVEQLTVPLEVLSDYSPEIGCTIKAIRTANDRFGPYIGGVKPGLFGLASFLPGSPVYTYPESLPLVNAKGGPNCRGLPNLPTKQYGGSWYRPSFLVTDNAYVPFQPHTELQIDAPSTLQFLFNGAYAERDDF